MTATVLQRAVGGVVACGVAAIPLAIAYSIYGFVSTGDETRLGYIVMGTLLVIPFACAIAVGSALFLGIPIYAATVRLKRTRIPLLLLSAIVVGTFVHEVWVQPAAPLFEDPVGALEFAFFGLYSGLAFWFGADVWRLINRP
jgi:hypothetical protein